MFTMVSKRSFVLLTAVIALSACSGAKESLGLTKKAPDEFQVVKRAPLAMPPDYALRPPQPGAARPQEQSTVDQARQAMFGSAGQDAPAHPDNAEMTLLQQAGAGNADPNIRNTVDAETAEDDGASKKPVIKRLLGSDEEPTGTVVDPKKEAQRLKENADAGKPVTEGATPNKDD